MRIRSIVTALTTAIGVLAVASVAAAQTVTGTLQGTVTDTGGGVLPGVVVTIKNNELGATREVTTNNAGFYTAPFLAIGTYTVTAKMTGFNIVVRESVPVTLNQTQVADFQLKPASVAETVTVVGAAPPINTSNGEIKGTLNEQQILDKPTLNPGSFLSLAEIFPGFQDNPTSGQNNPTLSSGSSINFNGTGTRGATFQINGVNNDDSSENQHRQGAALSTIKEFQVITNNYTAEFGRGYGAVVLVQTKSGTNSWRGDVYEFVQDSNDLTALRKFALVKPDNQRHQFGGTVGFPIVRDRLFGFGNFDRTKLERHGQLRARSVHAGRVGGAASDARQRHAGEPRLDRLDPRALSSRARSPTIRGAPGRTRRFRPSTGRTRTTPAVWTGPLGRTP